MNRIIKLSMGLSLLATIGTSSILPAEAGEFRTLNGSDNNLTDAELGESFTPLVRLNEVIPGYTVDNGFEDGLSIPRGGIDIGGGPLPNPRVISNIVGVQPDNAAPNFLNASSWLWQWGQFIDHDLDLNEFNTEVAMFPETDFIQVPPGSFVQDGVEITDIPFIRVPAALDGAPSSPLTGTPLSPRTTLNQLTHFIDGSNVYGSEDSRGVGLRSGLGGGRLLTFEEQFGLGSVPNGESLLPFNTLGLPNADDGTGLDQNTQFLAGDVRSSEQVGLTAVHTVFVREHNRLAGEIDTRLADEEAAGSGELLDKFNDFIASAPDTPLGDIRDEFIYQTTRKVVGGYIQQITYQEFLPLLLGPGGLGNTPLGDFVAYDPTVDPTVSQEFANSAYRLGHTFLNEQLLFFNQGGVLSDELELSLADAFFNTSYVTDNGVDGLLVGLLYQPAESFDRSIVDGVRNFLFPGGTGGLDLYSVNIARGRDVGLPNYVTVFNELVASGRIVGFGPIATQADLPFTPEVLALIVEAYDTDGSGDLDAAELLTIDLFVGGVAEGTLAGFNGGLVGPTVSAIIADQFARTRDGDRFFYLNPDQLEHLEFIDPEFLSTTLSDILRRNIDNAALVARIPDNAFAAQAVPEPMTIISLLGLGAAGLVSRRRKDQTISV